MFHVSFYSQYIECYIYDKAPSFYAAMCNWLPFNLNSFFTPAIPLRASITIFFRYNQAFMDWPSFQGINPVALKDYS